MPRTALPALLAVAMLSSQLVMAHDRFPLRKDYAEINCLGTAELRSRIDEVIVVDARNAMEYEVIHITGAYNFLAGKMRKGDLLQLRELSSGKPIVFYCNDHAGSRSYEAAEKARLWGFEGVYAYDAGIFDWSAANPDMVEFFGTIYGEAELQSKFISKEDFAQVCLEPEEFLAKVGHAGYRLYDIRDRTKLGKSPMRLPGTTKLSLHEMCDSLTKPGALPRSGLLIYDDMGKQVRWMQYYLEEHGITDYHFLKGGVSHWEEMGWSPNGKNPGDTRS